MELIVSSQLNAAVVQSSWKEKWQRARACLKTIYRGSTQPEALQLHGTKLDQKEERSSYLNEVIGIPLKLLTGALGVAHIEAGALDPFMDEWKGAVEASIRPGAGESFHDFMVRRGLSDGEKCKLLKNRITYYSAQERAAVLVTFKNQQLFVKNTLLPEGQYMFALDAKAKKLYVAARVEGLKHSSFLAGSAVRSAGYLEIGRDGRPLEARFHSGHYRPELRNVFELHAFFSSQDRLGEAADAIYYAGPHHA